MTAPKSYDPVTAEDDEADDPEQLEDDAATLDVERARATRAVAGRPWVEIAASHESLTEAFEIHEALDTIRSVVPMTRGCVLRVRAKGPDGEPMLSMVWLDGVTMADLCTVPDEARRVLESRGAAYQRSAVQILEHVGVLLEQPEPRVSEAIAEIDRWLGRT